MTVELSSSQYHSASWPGLSRPSTSFVCLWFRGMNARHKAGRDAAPHIAYRSASWGNVLKFDLAAQVGCHLFEGFDEVVADAEAFRA